MLRALAISAAAVLGTSCFDPSFKEGVSCGADRACPGDQICSPVDNRCYSGGNGPSIDASIGDPDARDEPDAMDVTTLQSQWVWSKLLVPEDSAQAEAYALDIDGTSEMRPDNALGSALATLVQASGGLPLQSTSNQAMATGEILHLLHVEASDWSSDPEASAWVYAGTNPIPTPCINAQDQKCGRHLGGDGAFDIDATAPTPDELIGSIADAKLEAGPGAATISTTLVPDAAPIDLPLVGVRVEIEDVTAASLSGRLGGAVREQDLHETVIPAFADRIATVIAEDCTNPVPPCCIDADSTGQTLIDLFSEDGDCEVTEDEVRDSSLISSLLAPDVDLFDAAGNFDPNVDGVNDSVSFGVGFTAVPATFPTP